MQAFWQEALVQVMELVLIVATPIVLVLGRKALQVLEKKFDIDIEEKQERKVDEVILMGVSYAREQGRKALKAGKDPIPGEEKKRMALDYITRTLDSTNATHWSRDRLEDMVEAKLNLVRTEEKKDKP